MLTSETHAENWHFSGTPAGSTYCTKGVCFSARCTTVVLTEDWMEQRSSLKIQLQEMCTFFHMRCQCEFGSFWKSDMCTRGGTRSKGSVPVDVSSGE